MNCEMAQRTIALAALAPTHTRQSVAPEQIPDSASEEFDLLEQELLAEHPELGGSLDTGISASAYLDTELREEERVALDAHLAECRECQAEMAATAAFYRALSSTRQPEPTPNLLARARLRLDTTLDNNAHQSALAHLLLQLSFSAGRLRAAPGLASALLLFGLVAGGYGGYRVGHAAHNAEQRQQLLGQVAEQSPRDRREQHRARPELGKCRSELRPSPAGHTLRHA